MPEILKTFTVFSFLLSLFMTQNLFAQEPIVPDSIDTDPVFDTVEIMPYLKQCESLANKERKQCTDMEIIKLISKITEYPEEAREVGIEGTVFVSFVVNQLGEVEGVKIARSVHPLLDEESMRVIQLLPKFMPGIQDGKKVKVRYTIPMKFVSR